MDTERSEEMSELLNQQILDYLAYYTADDRKLEYAVLLDGAWGSGKTHLIKNFLKQHSAVGGKHLYVSLYGLTSTIQIEEEFFRLLHPLLSSKGMRLAGKLLKGAAKGMLKVDLGSGGSVTETISLSAPEIDLTEFANGPGSRLLVFDDLERCSMPISDVLGYINGFVEHEGMKVIMLANEKEIGKADKKYSSIKEKLIGQTLRVRADMEAAYPEFLIGISNPKVRTLLEKDREAVLALHAASETNNLRILRQAMWDFERVGSCIPEGEWKKVEAVRALALQTIAMAMEIRVGRVTAEHLPLFADNSITRYLRRENGEEPEADELFAKRYPEVQLSNPPMQVDLLGEILIEGLEDRPMVREALQNSRYFSEASDLPAWRRSWQGFESSDEEYEASLKALEVEFFERKHTDPGIVHHIVGIRLEAAEIGALPFSQADVLAQCKAYVDDLVSRGILASPFETDWEPGGARSYGGLGFTKANSEEFLDFARYYGEAASNVAKASYPERARAVLAKLDGEPGEFRRDLTPNEVRRSPYYAAPILAAIPANEFVEKVMGVPPKAQIEVFRTLAARYESGMLQDRLRAELKWIMEVRQIFENLAARAKPMTKSRLTHLIADALDPLLVTITREQESD